MGMSMQDIEELEKAKIPVWGLVAASALAGGFIAAKYMPEIWIKGLRELGK
jgi:hypothetical protein